MPMFEEIAKEMIELQQSKNADYGSSFQQTMDKYGMVSLATRLHDKFSRFESLIKQPANINTESIEDTLIDLAAYAIMGVEWLKKKEPNKEGTIAKLSEEDLKVFSKHA